MGSPTVMDSPGHAKPFVTLLAVVTAAGLPVLAFGASGHTSERLGVLVTLIVLGGLAERFAIGLFKSDISVGVVTVMVAAVLAGPWGVAVVAPPIVLLGHLGSDAAWYKRGFNVGVYLLAGAAYAGVFAAFDLGAEPSAWPEVLAPAILGSIVNFAINSSLVAAAVALSRRESPLDVWRKTYFWLVPQYFIVGMAAMAAASAYEILGVWGLLVFAAPVAGIRHAYSLGASSSAGEPPELQRAA